jgi:hypothetical protein
LKWDARIALPHNNIEEKEGWKYVFRLEREREGEKRERERWDQKTSLVDPQYREREMEMGIIFG